MRTMEEKKEIVLRYLQSKYDWASPTEIGRKALGALIGQESSRACPVLFDLIKDGLVEREGRRAKYRIRRYDAKDEH